MVVRYGQALFSERQQVVSTDTTVNVDTGVAFLSTSGTTALTEPDFAFGLYSTGYLSYDTSGTRNETAFSGTWRPRGSYLFLEHSDAEATTANPNPIGARLSVITSGGLSNFYVGGFSSTIGTTDSPLVFGNSDTVTTTSSTSTEGNIALVDRINKWGGDLSDFQDPAYKLIGTYSGFWDIQMASAGAEDTDDTDDDATKHTGYTCTTSDSYALAERISGDRYTFRFDSTSSGVFDDAYDFAAGGDGSVSIGAYDTFDAVWLDSANSTSTSTTGPDGDAAFSSTPFTTTWAWPPIDTIKVGDAAFVDDKSQFGIASTLDEVYKNRSYGHSFNWRQGINFDVGTADGNDINLATSWAFSNFFWGDGPVRYEGDNPTISGSVKSGWSIPNKFEPSLTEDFTPTGLEETIYALNTIKSVFSVGTIAAVGTDIYRGIEAVVKLCKGVSADNYADNVFTNGLDDVDTWNFTAPSDKDGALITTADFADYSDKDSELYDTFKLDGDKLSLDRSIGAQIHYQKGDFFDYWEDTKGTSFTSQSFDDDGSVEKAQFENMHGFSQIGTNIGVSMVGVDLSSTAIGYHDITLDHQINIGISAVGTSVDLNVLGAKATFGHNAPSKIGVDAMKVSGTDLTVGLTKTGLKITALASVDKTKVDKNKTTLVGALSQIDMTPFTFVGDILAFRASENRGAAKLTAGTAAVKSCLLKSRLNALSEVKSTGAKASLSGLWAAAGVVHASATALANGTPPEPAASEQHEPVQDPPAPPPVAKEPAKEGEESKQADNKLSTTKEIALDRPASEKSVGISKGNTARLREIYEHGGKGNQNNK
jgi:hypothetical protein